MGMQVNGGRISSMPASESVAGRRTAYIGTWENRDVPCGFIVRFHIVFMLARHNNLSYAASSHKSFNDEQDRVFRATMHRYAFVLFLAGHLPAK